jgi:hypothetical protein
VPLGIGLAYVIVAAMLSHRLSMGQVWALWAAAMILAIGIPLAGIWLGMSDVALPDVSPERRGTVRNGAVMATATLLALVFVVPTALGTVVIRDLDREADPRSIRRLIPAGIITFIAGAVCGFWLWAFLQSPK